MDEEGIDVYTFEADSVLLPTLTLCKYGRGIGELRKKFTMFLSEYDIVLYGECSDTLQQEFTFFKPRLFLMQRGWEVRGDFFAWDYEIVDREGYVLAEVSQELFHLTKHFMVNIYDEDNLDLLILMVLGIYMYDEKRDSNSAASSTSN